MSFCKKVRPTAWGEPITPRNRLASFLLVTTLIFGLTLPATAEAKVAWDELIEAAALGAYEYDQTYREAIHAYTLLDIDGDGIPELFLTPLGGNRGADYPVLVYKDGQYRYRSTVHLGYSWDCHYVRQNGETSVVLQYSGGPVTERITSTTRLTLREDGIYQHNCRNTELWTTAKETGEWYRYASDTQFEEWLSIEDNDQGKEGRGDVTLHHPEDEDSLYYQWFEKGRTSTAPSATLWTTDVDFGGKQSWREDDDVLYVNEYDFVKLLMNQLGRQYLGSHNPNTGR